MTRKEDRFPKDHAYIRLRNRGRMVHIDYPDVDSEDAERLIEAFMAILRKELPSAYKGWQFQKTLP